MQFYTYIGIEIYLIMEIDVSGEHQNSTCELIRDL